MFRAYMKKKAEEKRAAEQRSELIRLLSLSADTDFVSTEEVRSHAQLSSPPVRAVQSSRAAGPSNVVRLQRNASLQSSFALLERNDRPSPTLDWSDRDVVSESELVDYDLGDNCSTDSDEVLFRAPVYRRGRQPPVERVAAPPERRAMFKRSVALEESSDESRPGSTPSASSSSGNESAQSLLEQQSSYSEPSSLESESEYSSLDSSSSPTPRRTSLQEDQESAPSSSAQLQSEEQTSAVQEKEESSYSKLKPLPFPRPNVSADHIGNPEVPARAAPNLFSLFRGRLAPIDRSSTVGSQQERRASFDRISTTESQSEDITEKRIAPLVKQESLTMRLKQDKLNRSSSVGPSSEKKYVEPLNSQGFPLKKERTLANVSGSSTDLTSHLPPIQQSPARSQKKKEADDRSTPKLPQIAPSTSSETEKKSKLSSEWR